MTTIPHTAGVMPLSRELGEKLDCKPIPELQPISECVQRPTRKSYWPEDVWADMQAIFEGRMP